jgi:hypothetical protein
MHDRLANVENARVQFDELAGDGSRGFGLVGAGKLDQHG